MLELRPRPPVILSVTDTLNGSNKDQHLYTEGEGVRGRSERLEKIFKLKAAPPKRQAGKECVQKASASQNIPG